MGPILMGEVFVNDGDRLSTQAVLIREDAATEQAGHWEVTVPVDHVDPPAKQRFM